MKLNKKTIFIVLSLIATLISCRNSENADVYTDENDQEQEDCDFDNPLDSIFRNVDEDILYDELYSYVVSHPEFTNQSDSVGYLIESCDGSETRLLWRDCGKIRVYSIPIQELYALYSKNIILFRDNGRIDADFLQYNSGMLDKLYEIKDEKGNEYYILKTNAYATRNGDVIEEYICAFSIKNGQLKKEKLFHANGKQYDIIEVVCGQENHPPLNLDCVDLISLAHFDDNDGVPTFVIAEINKNDWPTGYGLKYQWNGNWFEYVGKCPYNLDDSIRE